MDTAKTQHHWDGIYGTAPFRFLGMTVEKYQAVPGAPDCPIQPGAACDCCGQGIYNVFRFVGSAANDKPFKVGVDCARKATGADENMRRRIDEAQRDHDRKLRAASATKTAASVASLLADENVRAKLAATPHPAAWRAAKGDTWLDHATWMAEHCGARGLKSLAVQIAKVAS